MTSCTFVRLPTRGDCFLNHALSQRGAITLKMNHPPLPSALFLTGSPAADPKPLAPPRLGHSTGGGDGNKKKEVSILEMLPPHLDPVDCWLHSKRSRVPAEDGPAMMSFHLQTLLQEDVCRAVSHRMSETCVYRNACVLIQMFACHMCLHLRASCALFSHFGCGTNATIPCGSLCPSWRFRLWLPRRGCNTSHSHQAPKATYKHAAAFLTFTTRVCM